MSSNVSVRFAHLIDRIQPTAVELARLDQRYDAVRAKLVSVFPNSRVSCIGSHDRGTGVRGKSDVDILLEVSRNDIRRAGEYTSSTALLRRVKNSLHERYPNSNISVRGPAVVARFGAAPVDIVPGVFNSFHNGSKVLAIPDGTGEWMATCPKAHGRYIRDENRRSGGQLRYVAQLLKFWRHTRQRPLPIQSFHVEILLATQGICLGAKPYSHCVADALDALISAVSEPPYDPLGISGEIPVASTVAQLKQALKALNRAAEQAAKAVDAEQRGNQREACQWWNKVFKNHFPKK